ncbi:hypothetical protein [Levilactobacillus yonginensis]|uniref:hypothetical protein n=1 Tax=Levilactobacillus yonginensis TaxID=1054041 RepID=UPI000F792410|nr:hypothetical protein [Levilactobacillus yonginensis]
MSHPRKRISIIEKDALELINSNISSSQIAGDTDIPLAVITGLRDGNLLLGDTAVKQVAVMSSYWASLKLHFEMVMNDFPEEDSLENLESEFNHIFQKVAVDLHDKAIGPESDHGDLAMYKIFVQMVQEYQNEPAGISKMLLIYAQNTAK